MSKFRNLVIAAALVAAAPAVAGKVGLGRPALPAEIAAWDVNVRPDGQGLPPGSGSVDAGDKLFQDRCAGCHGVFGEGSGRWPVLAGGEGSLADKDPVKTVGSYWPYLSTTWDYVHRSMPFGDAQTLTADDTYALVAYILYNNGIVDQDFTLTDKNFLDVKMPNADGFVPDDRDTAEVPTFSQPPCMTACKAEVKITRHASVIDVTPDSGNVDEPADPTEQTAQSTQPATPAAPAAPDPEMIAQGERIFGKCKACHKVGPGAQNSIGPELNGVVGRTAGTAPGFSYSPAMQKAGAGGLVWSHDTMARFLADPRNFVKGTKMAFAGIKDVADRDALIAYLSTQAP